MTRYVYEKQMCFKIYRFDIDIPHCDVRDTLTSIFINVSKLQSKVKPEPEHPLNSKQRLKDK